MRRPLSAASLGFFPLAALTAAGGLPILFYTFVADLPVTRSAMRQHGVSTRRNARAASTTRRAARIYSPFPFYIALAFLSLSLLLPLFPVELTATTTASGSTATTDLRA